ncbi:MAG TPA: cytochrome c [Candidatus Baltobacteraceae bacterium]|jgi:mono/diheme cytochrome c family protein|nr:cytochrome c [Candidatus Baltobacteraceae bacterium]
MLRGILAGALLVIFATAIAGFVIIQTGTIPANADDKPPPFERWAAKTSLRATLSRSAPAVDAPIPADNANLLAGVKLYGQNCAVCHGDSTGKRTNIAKGLYQKPPQLGRHGVEDDPVGETYWKVVHGLRWTGMPSFRTTLNQTQIWQLTLFLKNMDHLPPAAQRAWRQMKAQGA